MADSKISALADGGAVQSADQFVVARSSADKKIAGSNIPGYEFDYVQITSNVSITATTDATATTLIDGNAVTYDGSTRIKIEFFALGASLTTGAEILFVVYDGATDIGRISAIVNAGGSTADAGPVYGALFVTPTAASHTYHVKAWKTGGTCSVYAGAGGAGVTMPAWYRITKA